jgi:hypothetical protein
MNKRTPHAAPTCPARPDPPALPPLIPVGEVTEFDLLADLSKDERDHFFADFFELTRPADL